MNQFSRKQFVVNACQLARSGRCVLMLCLSMLLTHGALAVNCQADLVRLTDGGEVRGKVVSGREAVSGDVAVKTVAGALVSVPSDQIEFITRRSLNYEKYEIQARLAADTVAAQWTLAEWCQEQRLTRQRELHLERIIELDPENQSAHQALGHKLRDGQWMSHAEYMQSQGYVRYRGRYITPEEKALQETSVAQRKAQQAWFAKIRVWSIWLTGRFPAQQKESIANFKTLKDPDAIPALQKFLADSESAEVRMLYVKTLGQIEGMRSIQALVHSGVLDVSPLIREQALRLVPESETDFASNLLIEYLGHEENYVVRRTGAALQQLGTETAVPHLIAALVTRHKYRVAVDQPAVGVTLGPGGQVLPGAQTVPLPPGIQAALLTGALPPENIILPQNPAPVRQLVKVQVDQQNPEVLAALREITSVDFGYDERTWNLWWLASKS